MEGGIEKAPGTRGRNRNPSRVRAIKLIIHHGIVVKHEKLRGTQRNSCIGRPASVGEFHFKNAGSEKIRYRAHLAAPKLAARQINNQGDNIQEIYFA